MNYKWKTKSPAAKPTLMTLLETTSCISYFCSQRYTSFLDEVDIHHEYYISETYLRWNGIPNQSYLAYSHTLRGFQLCIYQIHHLFSYISLRTLKTLYGLTSVVPKTGMFFPHRLFRQSLCSRFHILSLFLPFIYYLFLESIIQIYSSAPINSS